MEEKKEVCGVIPVNKHAGCTSLDIVNMIRRLYGTRRVGHTGTLDPMATGVLTVLIGRAAKAADLIVNDRKNYRAALRLGITTDTEDTTGKVLSLCEEIPCVERVTEVCRTFVGEISQVPPMYSALKVGGKKLVDLARQGIEVERKARQITIYSLKVTPTDRNDEYILDVECSGGTYIRTLCADIGAALGCGGAMASLERRSCGGFDISESFTAEALGKMSEEERLSCLRPVESLFEDMPQVRLEPFYERLCRSGCEIYQKKIGTAFNVGERLRISGKNGFFALGEVREYPDGSAVKAVKLFELN